MRRHDGKTRHEALTFAGARALAARMETEADVIVHQFVVEKGAVHIQATDKFSGDPFTVNSVSEWEEMRG